MFEGLNYAGIKFAEDTYGEIPDGRCVARVERWGEFTWLYRPGVTMAEALPELNDICARIGLEGQWLQNWDGPTEGPSRLRSVS